MPSDLIPGLTWPQRMTLDYEAWSEWQERKRRHEQGSAKAGDLARRLWSQRRG